MLPNSQASISCINQSVMRTGQGPTLTVTLPPASFLMIPTAHKPYQAVVDEVAVLEYFQIALRPPIGTEMNVIVEENWHQNCRFSWNFLRGHRKFQRLRVLVECIKQSVIVKYCEIFLHSSDLEQINLKLCTMPTL